MDGFEHLERIVQLSELGMRSAQAAGGLRLAAGGLTLAAEGISEALEDEPELRPELEVALQNILESGAACHRALAFIMTRISVKVEEGKDG